MSDIERCPFCRGFPAASSLKGGKYSVECYRCGASGPVAETDLDCWALWNERSGIPAEDLGGTLTQSSPVRPDGADDLEHFDGMLDDRERG